MSAECANFAEVFRFLPIFIQYDYAFCDVITALFGNAADRGTEY